ncbi:MAG TPA: rhomboid family intramembrane serine protease [Firmicutes bacterium]|nr:rhomboid family intramembrane serine protease [Bacillota bacterium]
MLNKWERKYGHLAIKNLMSFIVITNAMVYILMLADQRGIIYRTLILDPALVLKGQIWRLASFIFIPPDASPLWIVFALYFYYLVGSGLEQEWGSFKFNIYYLTGMIGTILAAFLVGNGATGVYLNLSLFLAFASIYPDFQINLFLILPVKVKYLAWLYGIIIAFTVITSPLNQKAAALVSLANFILFFGKDFYINLKRQRLVRQRRKRFFSELKKK